MEAGLNELRAGFNLDSAVGIVARGPKVQNLGSMLDRTP